MGISVKTRKMLWGRSANRCSLSKCRRQLVEDETEIDDPSIVGDEAHIVAREQDGPRGNSDLTADERDRYDNLMLLCKIHHKIIDDQSDTYTVERLKGIKASHIDWVDGNLDVDLDKRRDEEIYASYVDRWIELAKVDEWNSWSSSVLGNGGQPSIRASDLEQLSKLNEYIFKRLWSRRHEALEDAFKNFRRVLNDFLNVLTKYLERRDETDPSYWTEKFYRKNFVDQETYHKLLAKYEYHTDLVEDLMLELTRAANYLCDQVRKTVSPSFRVDDGVLLVTSGPHEDLMYRTRRVEYIGTESEDCTYSGLRDFMEMRANRDIHFGRGVSEDYF